MEILGAAIVAAAIAAVVVAFFLARRRPADAPLALLQQGMRADVALLQQTIAELRGANTQALAELRGDVQRSLGATEQQLLTQSGSTQRTLGELGVKLATLGEQSARIGELAKDVGSLHDLFRAPKLRGGFGEVMLERVLADNLPVGAFELQYGYRDGSRVDAVVRFAGRLVPIDAKFPIESFNAMSAARDDAERASRRRAFIQQVRRHVDAVAKYIAPAEGTIDYAFLYFPAEGVYYEAAIAESDLRDYCAERRVLPTSPNTLVAYLQMVSLGLRGLAMEERSRELQEGLRRAALELEKFRSAYDTLGDHLRNATKKHTDSLHGLNRTADAIEAVGRPLGAVEQGTLPLTGEEESTVRRLPFVARGRPLTGTLLAIAAAGVAIVAFTVATRDPDGPLSVGLVVAGAAITAGALAALALVSASTRRDRRGTKRDAAVVRGLRRGAMVGCVLALVALLRVLDGLTPLTLVFVVVPFVAAEAVLSTRRA